MPEKINVVHLIPSIGFGGGAENMVYHLFRTIDRERFHLTLMYWGHHEDLAEPVRATGAEVIKLPLKKIVSPGSVLKIASILRRTRAQVLHTHFMDADWLGFWAARLTGVPMMLDVHSFPFPERRRHAYRYRLMSPGIRKIVCVSHTVKDHVSRQTGIADKRFKVIYNGIDVQGFDRRAAQSDPAALRREFGFGPQDIVVGNVSRLIPDKGHEHLLRAMPAVMAAHPRVKLLIVGDGVLRDELHRLAEMLGIGGRVVFAGKRHDVPELLGMMDVFVFPTFNEAFGICVLEAMASGKPIIATDDAAIPEIIRHGTEGWLIPPGNAARITEGLLKFLSDGTLMRPMALAARARVESFSVDAMTRGYEELYSGIAGGSRKGGA
jgi:glycosyltransferase involved in cell wall biosynthesis